MRTSSITTDDDINEAARRQEVNQKPKGVRTINHLLNIDKFNGYHEGSIKPIVKLLVALLIPAFFVVNIYLFLAELLFSQSLAIIIVVVVYVLYGIRMGLLFIGNERERVKRYRKQKYSRYEELGEYVRIKTIHQEDGCIEFFDGSIAFMVVAYNGNAETFTKFSKIQKFLEAIADYTFDILVQNIADGSTLNPFYEKIKRFPDKEVAKAYLSILDYNKQYIEDKSLIARTVYIIYGKRYERTTLYALLDDALPERAYYDIHMADYDEVLSVYSHDDQLLVDTDDLITRRFASNNYYVSRVVGYDQEVPLEPTRKSGVHGTIHREFIPTLGGRS